MKKKSAFTFIEVMIAITVFAIGVLAVLRLITQNLVTLDATQSRTTATFLAKEWMELVYNMRDSNIAKWLPWDCVLKSGFAIDGFGNVDPSVCDWNFSSGNNLLQISFSPDGYTFTTSALVTTDFSQLWSANKLYYATWTLGGKNIFWYSSRPTSTDSTIFARYLLFTGVHEWQNILPRESILKVESHVLYMKWSKTWEVVLESFIGNY